MIVIGSTKTGIIVSAENVEIANLAGFSKYCEGYPLKDWNEHHHSEYVGKQIPITSLYKEATAALDSHKEAIVAAKKLRDAADKFLSFFAEKAKADTGK